MEIQTEQLILRELNQMDFISLCKILQDEKVMYAYAHAFSDQEVQEWLTNQIRRYQEDGHGLWAVILKKTGEMIGQCGLTNQLIHNQTVIEVGYLFQKSFWHHGYATQAAWICIQYAFHTYPIDAVYSIIRDNNQASKGVAERNGMRICDHILKHYYGIDMPHDIYQLTRNEVNIHT